MANFRPKQEISAVQFDGENFDEVVDFVGTRYADVNQTYELPRFDRVENWAPHFIGDQRITAVLWRDDTSGWVPVQSGDWIVRDEHNNLVTLTIDQFNDLYEPAGE